MLREAHVNENRVLMKKGKAMSFIKSGWDAVQDFDSPKEKRTYPPKRFWMPAEVTKRIMFLDEDPACLFEHNLWSITKTQRKEVCLKKNNFGPECPICDAELWPSFTGFFSVIDMGDVTPDGLKGFVNDKGINYQFIRKLYGAKRGGRDKPGVLTKIKRLADKKGGLTGTVWDVYRSGSKVESVGDEFEFVEKVSKRSWKKYLTDAGANPELLELEPFDYDAVFQPSTVEELRALIPGAGLPTNKVQSLVVDDDEPPFEM